MKRLLTCLVITSCFSNIFGLKLLLLFTSPGRSHYFLGNELAKGLANAGHEVTMVSPFSEKNPPKNYKEIVLSDIEPAFKNAAKDRKLKIFEMENSSPILTIFFMGFTFGDLTKMVFEAPQIEKLLKSTEHYDAVIVEQFGNDALKIFAYHFKAPLIIFNSVGPCRWVNNLVANPSPPSYVPDLFLSYSGDLNIWERMYNLLFGIISDIHSHWYVYPKQYEIIKKYYPDAPSFDEIQYNVSLILTNSHESVSQSVPHVPNMIDIGGFHVNPPKELPRDLKAFMDNATNGVIYFSMGSNLEPSQMPKGKKDAILRVLGARKEKILWKWDEDTLEHKPDNVFIAKWFPQQAILGHPNCKLFITHGGFLSTTETIYFGKPVLAIPIYGDQKLNAARAVSFGFGKSLTLSQLNENTFFDAVKELLENPRYAENAKTRSKIMHDRPIKPIDLATYWIEYVVRHKGAPHLRVAGINLPFYKYYMLDILGAVLGGFILVVYLFSKVIKWAISSRSKAIETKKKRN